MLPETTTHDIADGHDIGLSTGRVSLAARDAARQSVRHDLHRLRTRRLQESNVRLTGETWELAQSIARRAEEHCIFLAPHDRRLLEIVEEEAAQQSRHDRGLRFMRAYSELGLVFIVPVIAAMAAGEIYPPLRTVFILGALSLGAIATTLMVLRGIARGKEGE